MDLAGSRDADTALINAARDGDRAAFDALFERHKRFVYNVCLRILGPGEDAVDACQSTFVKAYRRLSVFRGDACFRTWLYRIAVNISVGLARKEKHRHPAGLSASPETGSHAMEDTVREAMLDLPPDVRAILVLFYFHGLSCEELAEALGCSEGAARVRLHRARKLFRKIYQEISR